jgi:Protein of unknown function (DUF1572)
MQTLQNDFLESAKKQFKYYRELGEKSFEQIAPEKLFHQMNDDSNSIAIIVQHLHGNMLSRWTDFLNSDGEKEWRKRDEEFESIIKTKEELLQKWNEGWNCLFAALDSIKEENFSQLIYIRNQGHTIVEAINRQLSHYPYHVGQIVFIAKMLSDKEWKSLSIPKNKSKDYNQDKFSKEKHKGHFTDDK